MKRSRASLTVQEAFSALATSALLLASASAQTLPSTLPESMPILSLNTGLTFVGDSILAGTSTVRVGVVEYLVVGGGGGGGSPYAEDTGNGGGMGERVSGFAVLDAGSYAVTCGAGGTGGGRGAAGGAGGASRILGAGTALTAAGGGGGAANGSSGAVSGMPYPQITGNGYSYSGSGGPGFIGLIVQAGGDSFGGDGAVRKKADGSQVASAVAGSNGGGGGGGCRKSSLTSNGASGGTGVVFAHYYGDSQAAAGGELIAISADNANYTRRFAASGRLDIVSYASNHWAEFAGNLSGATLVKSGPGTLILTGTNTCDSIFIAAGALLVGNGGTAGSVGTTPVTNDASLVLNRGDGLLLASAVSGPGSLTQAGTGTVVMTAAHTYTGPTRVTAGTLTVNGSLANANITVTDGLLNGSGTIHFRIAGRTADLISVGGTGQVDVTGLTLSVAPSEAPSELEYVLINDRAKVIGTFATTSLPAYWSVDYDGTAAHPDAVVLVFDSSSAVVTWDGEDPTDNLWYAVSNWVGNATPANGALLVFPAGRPWPENINDLLTSVYSLSLEGGYSLAGNPLSLGNSVSNAGNNTVAIPLRLGEPRTFVVTSGILSVPAPISGAGAILKTGAGTLSLAATNTYAGGTTLSAGKVVATMNTAQSSLGTGPALIGTGTALELVNVNTSALSVTVPCPLSGEGLLHLVFATNTTTRNTFMNSMTGFAGTVRLACPGLTGDKWNANNLGVIPAALQIENGCQLFAAGGVTTFTNGISVAGSGNSESRGAIRLTGTLGGDIALTDNTTIGPEGGILAGGISAGAASDLTLTVGTAFSTGSATFTGSISNGLGSLSLTKTAAGTLTLSGLNTYTGATSVAGGVLQIGTNGTTGTLGSGDVTVAPAASLLFSRSDGCTFGGLITATGTASVVQGGAGTITLNNPSNVIGQLLFSAAGTVDLGDAGAIVGNSGGNAIQLNTTGNATLAGTSGGTVKIGANSMDIGADPGGTLTISASIQNGGTNTAIDIYGDTGAGTVVLSGTNTYSGPTAIQRAVLSVESLNSVAGGLPASNLGAPVTVADGTISIGSVAESTLRYTGPGELSDRVINLAGTTTGAVLDQSGSGLLKCTSDLTVTGAGAKTLTLTGSNVGEFAGAVVNSGGGATSLAKTGSGTWTLSGANVYSGTTSVSGGVLRIEGAGTLGSTNASLSVNAGGTLDVNGTTQRVANLSGTGGLISNGAAGSDVTLTLGCGNGTGGNYAGAIADGGGTLALEKVGTGSITLSGTNTFTGGARVLGGTLALQGANAGYSEVGPGTLFIGSGATVAALSANTLGQAAGAHLSPLVVSNGTFLADAYNQVNSIRMTRGMIGVRGGVTQVDGVTLSVRSAALPSVTTMADTNSATISSKLTLAADTAFDIADGPAPVDLQVNGAIAGGSGLVKTGAGLMSVGGADSYTGATEVREGTLTLAAGGSLASVTPILVASNATLNLSGTSNQLGTGTGGDWSLAGTLRVTSNQPHTVRGNVTLSGGTMESTGGAPSDWGAFFVNSNRTFTANGAGNSIGGNGRLGIAAGAVLTLDTPLATDALTLSTIVGHGASGTAGGITKSGAGAVTLTASNAYAGSTLIEGGTLTVDGALANANITITGGTLNGSGTLNFRLIGDRADLISVSGAGLADITGLTLNLVRSGGHSATEYVLISDRTRVSGSFAATALPPYWSVDYDGTVANPGAVMLVFDATAAEGTWDGESATNGLWSAGLNWNGDTTPVGGFRLRFPGGQPWPTNVNDSLEWANSLSLEGGYTLTGNALALGTVVTNQGTNAIALPLTLSGPRGFDTASGNLTLTALSGTGGVVKAGAGTLTLTGTNVVYAGATSVSNGVLLLRDTTNFVSTATVGAAGVLQLNHLGGGLGGRARVAALVSGTGLLDVNCATSGIAGGWVSFNGPASGLTNFSGTVRVSSGVLTMDNTTGAWSGNPTLNVSSGGLFALRGQNIAVDALAGDGNVFNSAGTTQTLTVGAGNGSGTFAGTINGNGTSGTDGALERGVLNLVKAGSGTLTLAGTNTYSGATAVNGGTLCIAGAKGGTGATTVGSGAALAGSGIIAGAVSVNSGGRLEPGSSVGTLTVGSLTLATGSLCTIEFNAAPSNDTVVVTNTAGLSVGGGAFSLYEEGTTNTWNTPGTYNLIAYTGTVGGIVSSLSVANWRPGYTYSFAATNGWLTLTIAKMPFWTGGGGNAGWMTPANWDTGAAPLAGDGLTFGSTNALQLTNNNNFVGGQFAGIVFAYEGTYTLNGNPVQLTGNVVNATTNPQTLTLPLTMTGGGRTFAALDGDLLVTGAIGEDAAGRGLTKTGAASLVLGGTNTYTGPTVITDGSLQLAAGGRLGGGSYTGAITLGAATATLQYGGDANQTLSGVVSGPGALTKSGTATLILSGANTYSGRTDIVQGTLQIGNGGANGALGSGPYSVAAGSRLLLSQGASPVTAIPWTSFSGGGTLEISDAAAAGAVSYARVALPAGFTGTLRVNNRGRIWGMPADLGGSSDVVIGSGAQFMAYDGIGAGTNCSFGQPFTIAGLGSEAGQNFGALRVSGAQATFNGSITLSANAGLYTQSTTGSQITVNGVISGPYALAVNNYCPGSVTALNGNNTFSGGATLGYGATNSPAVALGHANALGSGPVTLAGAQVQAAAAGLAVANTVSLSAGGLQFGGTNDLTFAGAITLAGGDRPIANHSASALLSVASIATAGFVAQFEANAGAGSNGSIRVTGAVSGTGGIALTAASSNGVVELSGSSPYTGTTTVGAGTLRVTGVKSGGGAVLVGSGSTLAGTGTVAGAVTLSPNGVLAPGSDTPGTLTLTGGATLSPGAVLSLDVGARSDMLRVSGGSFAASGTNAIPVRIAWNGPVDLTTPHTLVDWSGATASGIAKSVFDLEIPAGFAGLMELDIRDSRLILVPLGGTLLKVR